MSAGKHEGEFKYDKDKVKEYIDKVFKKLDVVTTAVEADIAGQDSGKAVKETMNSKAMFKALGPNEQAMVKARMDEFVEQAEDEVRKELGKGVIASVLGGGAKMLARLGVYALVDLNQMTAEAKKLSEAANAQVARENKAKEEADAAHPKYKTPEQLKQINEERMKKIQAHYNKQMEPEPEPVVTAPVVKEPVVKEPVEKTTAKVAAPPPLKKAAPPPKQAQAPSQTTEASTAISQTQKSSLLTRPPTTQQVSDINKGVLPPPVSKEVHYSFNHKDNVQQSNLKNLIDYYKENTKTEPKVEGEQVVFTFKSEKEAIDFFQKVAEKKDGTQFDVYSKENDRRIYSDGKGLFIQGKAADVEKYLKNPNDYKVNKDGTFESSEKSENMYSSKR